jgi:biotin transport system substrate-specific component
MNMSTSSTSVHPIAVPGAGVKRLLGVALAIVATALGAYVAFPLPGTPVPVTLQTLSVVVSGALLGPWLGAAAMAGYLAVGIAGAPVFSAGGATFAWLLGPTGGYLVSFPAAAFVAGWAVGSGAAGWTRVLLALTAGTALIFVGGATQLALLTGMSSQVAVEAGVVPFLPGAILKIVAGAWIVRRLGVRCRRGLGLR